LNGQVFVICRDEARKIVALVVVDTSGRVSELGSLPVDFVEGSAQCQDELYVVGSQGQMFHSLRLEADGSVGEDIPLLAGPDILLAPRLACGYGTHYALWVDSLGQLQLIEDQKVAPPLALTDITLDLVPVVTPNGLTLLRNVGIPGYLELIHREKGSIQRTQAIEHSEQGYSPLLFVQEDQYLLVWLSRQSHSIQMQLFDSSFAPRAPARALLSVRPPDGFRWVRGIQSNSGKILLFWQIERPGMEFSDTGAPLPELIQSAALLDLVNQRLHGTTAIGYQAESYATGVWVDDRFVFVLGGGQMTILMYRLL
jgi:hypothetical protein